MNRKWPSIRSELRPPAEVLESARAGPESIIDFFPDVVTLSGWGWVTGTAGSNQTAIVWSYRTETNLYVVGGDLEIYVSQSAPVSQGPTGGTPAWYFVRVGTNLAGTYGGENQAQGLIDPFWNILPGERALRRNKNWRLAPYGHRVLAGRQIVCDVQYRYSGVGIDDMIYAQVTLSVVEASEMMEPGRR